MALPKVSITLQPDQVEHIIGRLGDMRHTINNYLSLITAAAEIAHRKPELTERMMGTLTEQPQKITNEIRKFSDEFEQLMGMSPDP